MINKRNTFKRIISILTVVTIIVPIFTQLAISAEETDKYPYNIFGRNGIEISAGNLCINGDVHTNKEANIMAYGKNINGKITTGNDIEKRVKHVYADTKIREKYFTENCELYEDGYVKSEMNIHINSPVFSYRNIELDGNVALNSNIGTLMNINVTGEVKNANTSVVYSKYGNITIENDSTANINGLIYAPLGTLTINSPNVSINGIIIADKIIINGNSINLNGNDNIARFIGTESEVYDFSDLEYLPEDWLGDTDEDILFDIYEKVIDTDPFNPDTDGDKLPDGYEVLTLNTDPLEVDTDENGISDADEDFDNDNLNNLGEYENKTGPFNSDTDDDGLLDGDEIKKYKTDPLNPDTDNDGLLDGEEGYDGTIYKKYEVYFDPLNPDTNGNGILDGDEVFGQTKKQNVETHDEAITEIKVNMSTNGNLERNLKIESMYGIDAMSSDVYAMIGEPFNFETSTKFNAARITFKIDQSKLGDTEFDNLIILWYNEKEQIFEEMPTTRNRVQSTISTKTTHFSQYIVVDSAKWYANWESSFTKLRKMWSSGTTTYKSMNTVFIVDCSSDMSTGDSRISICRNIMNNMMTNDKAAVITYASGINSATGFMSPQSALANLESNISNFGVSSSLIRAFNKAMNLVYSSDAELNRIIIITTSNSTFTFDLDEYNFSGVNVNVIDLGDYSMGLSLFNVTQLTGGGFYNAITADALTYQKGEEIYTPPQFIGEDSDGDTIPDIVEEYGLKPNGQPIGTNKLLKDTDGDGLDDNVELRFSVDSFKNDMDNDNRYYCRALYMATDPTKYDTDGDGFNDKEDIAPLTYEYVNGLDKLCDIAVEYMPNDFYNSQLLVLQIIRKDYYNGGFWSLTAGSIDEEFITYLKENYSKVYNEFIGRKNRIMLNDPITNELIDFPHFAASINAYYYTTLFEPLLPTNKNYINNFAGWLGDYLSMLYEDFSYEELQDRDTIDIIPSYIGSSDHFGYSDVLSDLDATNIYYINSGFKMSVSDSLNFYYRNLKDNSHRYGNFVYNLINESGMKNRLFFYNKSINSYKNTFIRGISNYISHKEYKVFNGLLLLTDYTSISGEEIKKLFSNKNVINNSTVAFADYIFNSINSCDDVSYF